jgi:hypothetical protein
VERRYKESAGPHLRPLGTVDSVCTMGMMLGHAATISTTIQNSHSRRMVRGLLCAQLLARMLHPLAKTTIARHLAAHFVHAMNNGRMIPAAKRLTDFDELHFQ